MNHQKLYFENSEGDKLAAYLDTPVDKQPKAYVLFAHCFTCNKNLKAVGNISRSLTQEGFGVFRFDFTGLGESEGDFEDTNFSSNVEDLVKAAQYLEEEFGPAKMLIGHSLGGSAVILAAKQIETVDAIVTIGAPSEPEHVEKNFSSKEIEKEGKADVTLAGRTFSIKKQFLEDIRKNKILSDLPNLKKAILILHSPSDNVVSIDNAAKLYKAALHPKSFVTLSGADHLLSRKEDSIYAGKLIAAWSLKYINVKTIDPDFLKTKKQVGVRIGKEKYITEIVSGNHTLIADEPKSMGGENLGPSPYDLLAASLGSCTAITLRMYADRKGWSLSEVVVHVEHRRTHAKDCNGCENDPGKKIDHLDRFIELEGDLDQKQRKRLLEIADKCPVHKTLSTQTQIHTELVKESKS